MAEQEDDEVGESDARLLFMFQYLSKSMRFKVDKWHKMMASEENKITVMEFLARAETKRLIFVLAYNGALCPSDQFPTACRTKACFFLKKEAVPVTVDNMKSMFIFGDISPKALDQLAVLVEDVILPMLTSNNNKIGWPKSVAEDVKKRVLDMKDVVFRVKGEVYGRTLLPLPQGIERVHDEYLLLTEGSMDSRSCDMELRCTIESAVLRWSNQLNEVLKQSSASVFESEVNPVPEAEINFWSQRSKNLCGIYEQLRDHRVKEMATILEKTESAYFPCFQKMFKSVVSAMNEAEEIDRYLQVIVPHITEIQSVPFIEAEPSFMPLVHNIALIWVHCAYFRTSTKLVILLKEICNLLMQEANKLLDPNSLFECEIEETLPKTRKVLRNLDLFRKIVLLYADKIVPMFQNNTKPVPWTFDECLVFERYDKYIDRLKLIKELFVTTMEYMKLEKVEVGGNKAHALSLRLNELFENFNNLTASFSSLPYDPTNIDDDLFMEDYQRFKATIMDCDRRLASVACMAFDDCTNFEQIFKMMNVFGGLLVRPVIKAEIEPKYEHIITLFEKEVNTVQVSIRTTAK
ncbi:hypothetical protein GE061_000573 [Apolygus lucorum]|uniref:Dynein heavy chain tail domain-containing protein n=1 Tax=Apolygus lucorum TaxID=248454 RepID=A0A8S9Y4Z2_APOLU|nr:hypothetical protein GE061_000573 [Apolygus lucorum]